MIFNINNNNSINNYLSNNQSLLILIGLLTALIPGIYFSEFLIYYLLILSTLILLGLSLYLTKKATLKVLFWCMIGFLVLAIKNNTIDNDYSSFFPRGDCGAEIQAVLIDSRITGSDVSWMPELKYFKVKVCAVRFSDSDKWKKTYGFSNIYFSEKNNNLKYGDLLQLKGNFIRPEKSLLPGSFDYGNYLRLNGINRIFLCSDYKLLRTQKFPYNIYRAVFLIRDRALSLLCYGIEKQNIKTFLAGFFFGCRQGLSNEVKQNFFKSGTIHILAISGLHIGVLTLILLLVLRPLPITAKYLIIPALLLCYIALTGFRPSGVRALLMISILCIHRAFFYSSSPVNSIAFAAVILLLINPYSIASLGFQFSFIVAGLLILSWEKLNKFLSALSEKERWKVKKDFSLYIRLRKLIFRKTTLLIATCVIAGIAGTGLILYYQNLFIPLMFITNIIILPLLLPLFLIGFLKIILVLIWGGFASIFNYLLTGVISSILLIAKAGASAYSTFYFLKPSIIILILFYILLFFFFITNSNKKRIISFCIVIAIITLWVINHVFSPGFISIVQEKGNSPSAVIIKPNEYLSPIIINCSKKMSYIFFDKLKQEGINRIGCIVMTGANSKLSGGIIELIKKIQVERLLIFEPIYKNKLYHKIIEQCRKSEVPVFFNSSQKKKKLAGIDSNLSIKFMNTDVNIKVREINPGHKKISVEIGSNKNEFYIKNSNQNQIFEQDV